MALQLPPPPHDPRVPLPPAPAFPPTLATIYEARRYTERVLQSLRSEQPICATIDDVGRAILYESSVAQVFIGPAVAPPWFAPVQQQLDNIQQQLNDIQQQQNNFQQQQNVFQQQQNQQLNRMDNKASRALNATNDNGVIFPFEIVLFVNGTDPTAHPNNLPPLTSTAVIDALQGIQATNYLNGYGLAVPHLVAERLRILRVYIGCRQLR